MWPAPARANHDAIPGCPGPHPFEFRVSPRVEASAQLWQSPRTGFFSFSWGRGFIPLRPVGIFHVATFIPCHLSTCCVPLERAWLCLLSYVAVVSGRLQLDLFNFLSRLNKPSTLNLSSCMSQLCSHLNDHLLDSSPVCGHLYCTGTWKLEAVMQVQPLNHWVAENEHFPWLGGSILVKAGQYAVSLHHCRDHYWLMFNLSTRMSTSFCAELLSSQSVSGLNFCMGPLHSSCKSLHFFHSFDPLS